MRTFEEYVKESYNFRLGGSQKKGFNQQLTFGQLEKGDTIYHFGGSQLYAVTFLSLEYDKMKKEYSLYYTFKNQMADHYSLIFTEEIKDKHIAYQQDNITSTSLEELFDAVKKRYDKNLTIADLNDWTVVLIKESALTESEDINEMSSKMIINAYDKAKRKYGKDYDKKYPNLGSFNSEKQYADDEVAIFSTPRNLDKNITIISILKDKIWYTLTLIRRFGRRLKAKLSDGFDNVDNKEFVESLPDKASDAIVDCINNNFNAKIDKDDLLSIV